MKRILRFLLIFSATLWLVNYWFPQGLVIKNAPWTFFEAGFALTIANYILKPIFKLLMLPINLLTFGLFRWVINVAILWIVVNFVGNIQIQPFNFPGADLSIIIIPQLNFNTITAWIAISFLVSFTSGFLIWLAKK